MPNSPYVIAISGPSGAGKSTLVQNLINLLGDAVALRIDDYTEDAIYPPSLEWVNNGANPDEFITPQFVANVRSLKEGMSIVEPEGKSEVLPRRYILVEEPFGRSRTVMRPLIDFHVQIEIPLEIALARRVLRNIERSKQNEDSEGLTEFLNWYLRAGRDFFIAVQERAASDKDLSVDGTLPPDVVAKTIFDAIMQK